MRHDSSHAFLKRAELGKPPARAPMAHKTPAEVASALAVIERERQSGQTVEIACRRAGVPIPTYYRWRAAASPSPKAATSPEDLRKDIMRAAKEVFLREGYHVSLARIAQAAGVARQTLYNQFGSKEALFSAIVQEAYRKTMSPVLVMDKKADFLETMRQFARYFLANALDAESLDFLRISLGEFRTHPELTRLAYSLRAAHAVPVITDHIAAYLKERMEEGVIDAVDPMLAAEAFCGSFTSHPRHRALIGLGQRTAEALDAAIELSVKIFARGLGYDPGRLANGISVRTA